MYLVNMTTQQEVPLKSMVFEADIFASRFCRLTMQQEYINESSTEPIECVYYFPSDIGYGLNSLKMELYDLTDPDREPSTIETVFEERKVA